MWCCRKNKGSRTMGTLFRPGSKEGGGGGSLQWGGSINGLNLNRWLGSTCNPKVLGFLVTNHSKVFIPLNPGNSLEGKIVILKCSMSWKIIHFIAALRNIYTLTMERCHR